MSLAKPPPDTANPKDMLGTAKPNVFLVPPILELLVAKVMELGGAKYEPYNFRESAIKYSVYISAIKRHLDAILDGEDNDRESGMPHEAHIAANCAIMLDCMGLGKLIDDRPPRGCVPEVLRVLDGYVSPKMKELAANGKIKPPVPPDKLPRKNLRIGDVHIDCGG